MTKNRTNSKKIQLNPQILLIILNISGLCALIKSQRLSNWMNKYNSVYIQCVPVCSVMSDYLWTVAHQVLLSVEFSRQEHWSGLPFSPAGDLPKPGTESRSPALAGRFFTIEPPRRTSYAVYMR